MSIMNPVKIPVPSGRLLFANDLRPLTGLLKSFDTRSPEGVFAMSLQYSFYGMAHVFVGNTSPAIVRVGDELHVKTNTQAKGMGSIDTALWWYSAMDAEKFVERCALMGEDPAFFDTFEVEVTPGVYAFTREDVDRDARNVVLSRILLHPMPISDLRQAEPDFGMAERFVKSSIWRAVLESSYGVNDGVEDIFTVLGNGYDWHHGHMCNLNGHEDDVRFSKDLPQNADVDTYLEQIPDLPGFVPGIRGTGRSYPISSNYPKLGAAPLNADPHALALGMMFIKSRLQHPPNVIGAPGTIAANEKKFHPQLKRELAVAVQIAETRGLFADGTMNRIFSEIVAAWTPAPREEAEISL